MYKKASVPETITWFVATLIIVIILLISIFLVSILPNNIQILLKSTERADLFVTKSLTAYLLTEESGINIYNQLKQDEDFNEFNGNLAVNIFKQLYEDRYGFNIWMGVEKANDYFSGKPIGQIQKSPVSVINTQPFVSELIKLNGKNLELILLEK